MGVPDDTIAGVHQNLKEREDHVPLARIEEMETQVPEAKSALGALRSHDGAIKIIPGVKRSSPSKGALAAIPDPAALASTYETGGVSIISVPTEQCCFNGSFADLDTVRAVVDIPILREDFIVASYQIREAHTHGADLMLLIVVTLKQNVLVSLLERTRSLGTGVLVGAHSRFETPRVVETGTPIIGANAHNLKMLEVDRSTVEQVIDVIPQDIVAVAESGVANARDAFEYAKWGADAVLVDRALMASGDPRTSIQNMVGTGQHPALRADRKARVATAHQEEQR